MITVVWNRLSISYLSGHFDVKGPARAQKTATLDFFNWNQPWKIPLVAYFLAVKASEAYLVICLLPCPHIFGVSFLWLVQLHVRMKYARTGFCNLACFAYLLMNNARVALQMNGSWVKTAKCLNLLNTRAYGWKVWILFLSASVQVMKEHVFGYQPHHGSISNCQWEIFPSKQKVFFSRHACWNAIELNLLVWLKLLCGASEIIAGAAQAFHPRAHIVMNWLW
jgi:hypothetical protein